MSGAKKRITLSDSEDSDYDLPEKTAEPKPVSAPEPEKPKVTEAKPPSVAAPSKPAVPVKDEKDSDDEDAEKKSSNGKRKRKASDDEENEDDDFQPNEKEPAKKKARPAKEAKKEKVKDEADDSDFEEEEKTPKKRKAEKSKKEKKPKKEKGGKTKKGKAKVKEEDEGDGKKKGCAFLSICCNYCLHLTILLRRKKGKEEPAWKWWLDEKLPKGVKWKTLEHNGVVFPPDYEPHGVKMLYDNEPVDVCNKICLNTGPVLTTNSASSRT